MFILCTLPCTVTCNQKSNAALTSDVSKNKQTTTRKQNTHCYRHPCASASHCRKNAVYHSTINRVFCATYVFYTYSRVYGSTAGFPRTYAKPGILRRYLILDNRAVLQKTHHNTRNTSTPLHFLTYRLTLPASVSNQMGLEMIIPAHGTVGNVAAST